MAGLLDIFDDPGAQLGLGLLAAASPRADAAGFGQRLMEGVGNAQTMRNAAVQRQLQDLQIQKSKIANGFLSQFMGGGVPAAATGGVSVAGGAPAGGASGAVAAITTPDGRPNMSMIGRMSEDQVAAFHLATGQDITPLWKIAKEGFKRDPGAIYEGTDGTQRYIPDVKTGLNFDPRTNTVSALPGYADTQAGITTATEGAKQRAINAQTLMPNDRINPTTGRPYDMTVDAYINGGQKQAPTTAPTTEPKKDLPLNSPSGPTAGSNTPQAFSDQIALLTKELQKPGMTQDYYDGVRREIARANEQASKLGANTGVPVRSGFAGPGDALKEKVGIENQGAFTKAQLEDAAKYKGSLDERVQAGGDLNMRLRESLDALDKFKAGGGTEVRSHLAQIAQGFGASPELVTKIANGDLAAQQEFSKLAAQQAMEQLKTIMAGSGRMTQFEFKVFESKNPNLDTDPNATRKIYDFITKTYNRDLSEQKAFESWVDEGKDPARFRSFWAKESSRLGYTDPNLKARKDPEAPPAPPQPTNPALPVPVKGMVRNGFKFIGGDPADKSNWTPVRNPTAFGSVSGG